MQFWNSVIVAFSVNRQNSHQKSSKSQKSQKFSRSLNKSYRKSNFEWKNGTIRQKIPIGSKTGAIFMSWIFKNQAWSYIALTLEPMWIIGHVIPFFHSKFDFLQLLVHNWLKIPSIGDFDDLWWVFWRFTKKARMAGFKNSTLLVVLSLHNDTPCSK